MKAPKPLKVYVWEDVLTDYSEGIIVVLAESKRQAWQLLKAKDKYAYEAIREQYYPHQTTQPPRLVTKPEAFVVWGGS